MGISTPLLWCWPTIPIWAKLAVSLCAGGALIAETFNSALEGVIDYLAPDYHPEAGYIKDVGSAAVMIALLLWGLSWGVAIWVGFYSL